MLEDHEDGRHDELLDGIGEGSAEEEKDRGQRKLLSLQIKAIDLHEDLYDFQGRRYKKSVTLD